MEIIQLLLGLNLGLTFVLFLMIFFLNRKTKRFQNSLEVRYFKDLKDNEGVVKNSQKYIVKGQVFFNGLPVGSQFIMSEHIIREFDWEKFEKLRGIILAPMLEAGVHISGIIGSVGKGAGSTFKRIFKKKIKS